ncbi:MAG: hypothetical protein CMJ81_01755 [Planctomycetaceae bacterium]|nr:hypothetical protein [Planctomycetaceae bacterium]
MTQNSRLDADLSLREQFWRDGYLILHDVVPPDRLESLRKTVGDLVERRRAKDPDWDTCATPRSDLTHLVEADSLAPVELALHDNTLGISARLLGDPPGSISLTAVTIFCNPEFEPVKTPTSGQSWGTDPRNWHRDVRPDHDGPLSAVLAAEEANGFGYVQWNIALYDDSVFYLIPGSHRRLNSEAEALQLQSEGGTQSQLDGSVCADLKPGSGVVYNSMLLHWGSKYSRSKKRRTVQLGFRSFGRFLPHQRHCRLRQDMLDVFSADSPQRAVLERSFALFRDEFAVFEDIFRAVLGRDQDHFWAGLRRLHPGSEGRLSSVVILTKIALELCDCHQRNDDVASGLEGVDYNSQLYRQLCSRFTETECEQLRSRFSALDVLLRSGDPVHVSGFLGPPSDYLFEHVPPGLTVESAIGAIFSESV